MLYSYILAYNYTMTTKPIARKIYIRMYKLPSLLMDKHMFVCYHVKDGKAAGTKAS